MSILIYLKIDANLISSSLSLFLRKSKNMASSSVSDVLGQINRENQEVDDDELDFEQNKSYATLNSPGVFQQG